MTALDASALQPAARACLRMLCNFGEVENSAGDLIPFSMIHLPRECKQKQFLGIFPLARRAAGFFALYLQIAWL
jgi:hypothetical protein